MLKRHWTSDADILDSLLFSWPLSLLTLSLVSSDTGMMRAIPNIIHSNYYVWSCEELQAIDIANYSLC